MTEPDGRPDASPAKMERRGMDAVTLGYIRQLHEQFVTAHGDIHTVYVAAHEREHEAAEAAATAALALAATRLVEVERAVREHYDTILTERDLRYEERFAASQVAVQAALIEREKAVQAAFSASEAATLAAFEASKEAIIKSEISVIKQSDATFVKIDKLQDALSNIMPKDETLSRFASVQETMGDIRVMADTAHRDIWDRLKTLEASTAGRIEQRSEFAPWVAAAIALIGVLVSVAAVAALFLTTKH